MAETPQTVISKLKLTPDRKQSFATLTSSAKTNAYVINEFGDVLTALSSMSDKELSSKTGLSKKDVDSFRTWRNDVINDVTKREPKAFSGGKYYPGKEAAVTAGREKTVAGLQQQFDERNQITNRGLLGDVKTGVESFITGYQAPRRATALTKLGLPIDSAFKVNQDDPVARLSSEFGYGYGQNLMPTVSSIPGLVGGGAAAGLLDRAVGSRLPNNALMGLLRTGGLVAGAMGGANVTSSMYDKAFGPYTGLSEDQAKQIQGRAGREMGGAAEQLGKFGATATVFGAPAVSSQGRISLFEGAGLNKSFRSIVRNPNQALNDPAVKEFIGDAGERAYSVITSLADTNKNNEARIQDFIKRNGREPSAIEKQNEGILNKQQTLLSLAPDILFGGLSRYGQGFSPFSLIQGVQEAKQGARGGQPTSPTSPTAPGVQPGVSGIAPNRGTNVFRFNVNLKTNNTDVPHTIAFDQGAGTASVNQARTLVPTSISIPASERLIRYAPVRVGNTDVSVRGITGDGDIIIMSVDNVTGAMSLQTQPFKNLPDQMRGEIDQVLRDTRVDNKYFPSTKLPDTTSYNPMYDSLQSFAGDYKTKVNIDGTEVNAAIVNIVGNVVTVQLPSGIRLDLPKNFFADPEIKTQTLQKKTFRMSNEKQTVGEDVFPAAVEYNGVDMFVPDPRRPGVKNDPASWANIFGTVPTEAQKFKVGTVLDLGALNGQQQVGVVVGYKQFTLTGPSAGYVVQSLNNPRMEPFMVPHDPMYVRPINPGDNPFVGTTAPTPAVASTSTTAPTAPVAPIAPGLPVDDAASVESAEDIASRIPTITSDSTGAVVVDTETKKRILQRLHEYFTNSLNSDVITPEQDGDYDASAISSAIGEDVNNVDSVIDELVGQNFISIGDDGTYDFSEILTYSPEDLYDGLPSYYEEPTAPTGSELGAGDTAAALPGSADIAAVDPAASPVVTPTPAARQAYTAGDGDLIRKISAYYMETDPSKEMLGSVTVDMNALAAEIGADVGVLTQLFNKMVANGDITNRAGRTYDLTAMYKEPSAPTPTPTPTDAEIASTEPEDEAPSAASLTDIGGGEAASTSSSTREPRVSENEDKYKSAVPPEDAVFPYGNKFDKEAEPGSLPVTMEDYRSGKTRYRRQTAGEEVAPITLNDFRRLVPQWAQGIGGFSKVMGRIIVPLLDKWTEKTGSAELNVTGVSNKQELTVALQNVFGQTPDQAAALAEWVDRWSLAWAREFARMHGIRTMDRLRAVRLDEDPKIKNVQLLTKRNEQWKRAYREQMLPSTTAENAEILRTLQRTFYTQRLGVLSALSTQHSNMLGGVNGVTFSINGDGKRIVNVVLAMHGTENYVTQVHEVNHALVRSLYAPMIHQLASKMYPAYRQQYNTDKQRQIQRDIEERIVTELTNMMFNSPDAGDFNMFAGNEEIEGGFDVTLNKLILNMGQMMRDSLSGQENNVNDVSATGNKGWHRPFPADADGRSKLVIGTPIIADVKVGPLTIRKTFMLAEPIRPGQKIEVHIPNGWDKKNNQTFQMVTSDGDRVRKVRELDPTEIQFVGQTAVTHISKPVSEYMSTFMGHWYTYTTDMLDKLAPDVPIDVENFNSVSVVEIQRATVGYRWWQDFADARKQVGKYNEADYKDFRISARINDSYLGWLDKGGYEAYRITLPGQIVEGYVRGQGLEAELTTPPVGGSVSTPSVQIQSAVLSPDASVTDSGSIEGGELTADQLLEQAMMDDVDGGISGMFMNRPLNDIDVIVDEGDGATDTTPGTIEITTKNKLSIAELDAIASSNVRNAIVATYQSGGDRKYTNAVEKILAGRFLPSFLFTYIFPKHAWLGDAIKISTSNSVFNSWYNNVSVKGFGLDKQLADDVKQTVYVGGVEGIRKILNNVKPIRIEGSTRFDDTNAMLGIKGANGITEYKTVTYGQIWDLMRKEMTKSIDNGLNQLRRESSSNSFVPDNIYTYLRSSFIQIQNDTYYGADPDTDQLSVDAEQVSRAATLLAINKFNTKRLKDGTGPIVKFEDFVKKLKVSKNHQEALLKFLDGMNQDNFEQRVAAIEDYILKNPALRTGTNAIDLFRGIHVPYMTRRREMSNTSQRQRIFFNDGSGNLVVPLLDKSKFVEDQKFMQGKLYEFRISQNARSLVSLDDKVGSEDESRSRGEEIGVVDTKLTDIVNALSTGESQLEYIAIRHKAMKFMTPLLKSPTFYQTFFRGTYGQAIYDANKTNKREEPIGRTIAKYDSARLQKERLEAEGKSFTSALSATFKTYEKRVNEFNAYADDLSSKSQVAIGNILNNFDDNKSSSPASKNAVLYNVIQGIATSGIDFTTDGLGSTLIKEFVGTKPEKKEDIRPITFDANAGILKHAYEIMQKNVLEEFDNMLDTEQYENLRQSLTPVESLVLARRSMQLRKVGILPRSSAGSAVTKTQLISGLHISDDTYNAATKKIVDKINTIETQALTDVFTGEVTPKMQLVKDTLTLIDTVIAKIEETPETNQEFANMTTNEKRLHLLLERQDYKGLDENGDVIADPVMIELARAMNGAPWIRKPVIVDGKVKKNKDNKTVFTTDVSAAQDGINAAITTLYDAMVIPPTTAFPKGFDFQKDVVTTKRLKSTDVDLTDRAKTGLTVRGKVLPVYHPDVVIKGMTMYQRLLGLMNFKTNEQHILTDNQLRDIVKIGADNLSTVEQAINFDNLRDERDKYIKGPLEAYLKNHNKALSAMTIADLNAYLQDEFSDDGQFDQNSAFAVMSNIMRILTQERSTILPFVAYTGRLPNPGELTGIATAYAKHAKVDQKKAEQLVVVQYNNLQENVASTSLAYMTNAANVTLVESEVAGQTKALSISFGLSLNDSASAMDPVSGHVRNEIIDQQKIFGDRNSKEITEKFGLIHDAVTDLKERAKFVGMTGTQADNVMQMYTNFASSTKKLVARNINDVIWGSGRKGRTNIPAPGSKDPRRVLGEADESVFAQAVKNKTEEVIKSFFDDLQNTELFESTRQMFMGFPSSVLINMLKNPSEANRPENAEIKSKLINLTEAVAKDMIQARVEIVRALNDAALSTYEYVQVPNANSVLVDVIGASGEKVMRIDYTNTTIARYKDGVLGTVQMSPVAGRGMSFTATALVDLMLVAENVMHVPVTPEQLSRFTEAQQGVMKDADAKRMAMLLDTRKKIIQSIKTLKALRVMPAEYWHGRDRVKSGRRSIEPMFMNRSIDSGIQIDEMVGTRDMDTIDEYVKPVINKWIQPDETGRQRVQLNSEGVPAWDGYGYTVETAQGTRSQIYSNLRVAGLPHYKALELYAMTEHPEFKAWQAGDLVDSVQLHDTGSLETSGINIDADTKTKMHTVMNAHRVMTSIDAYNENPTSENYENLKFWYDETFPIGDNGRPLSTEQLEKRVQEIANDSILLESVRVQADKIKTIVNTNEVQYYTNPIMSHMEGQVRIKTNKPFTTLGFGLVTNGLFNYNQPGVRVHDLGSGLHNNDNRTNSPRWIKMDKPLVIDLGNNGVDTPTLQKHFATAIKKGHDGVVFTNYKDSLFSPVTRNVAITLNDANVKSVATMHVPSSGIAEIGTVARIEPMFMNKILAPVTKTVAPVLLEVELEDVKKTGAENVADGLVWAYDNYQSIARSALSLDFAFTAIQGGRALLGLFTLRPWDTVIAVKALVGSMVGMMPNTSITMFGKRIGFDKLGRRAYMNLYLQLRKDPYWEVMKELKLPLHMMNLEKRLEAERDKLYREAKGEIAYEDIPMDLMEYDERGNLTDFFEKNTIIGSMPLQGMFERQISLQHDLLLFGLVKHQLMNNPIIKDVPLDEVGQNRWAKIAANYVSLSLGDFQYSTDEKRDAKFGRLGKFMFVAPRWLFANVLLNPIANNFISNSPALSQKARQVMGNDNRVFDLYPKDLWEKNKNLALYQASSYWGTALFLLMMQLGNELYGMYHNNGKYNATIDKLGAFRTGDWKISDSTGTMDLMNLMQQYPRTLFGGDPGKPGSPIQSEENRWAFSILNTLGYRASPVLGKPLSILYGKDVLNKPIYERDKFLEMTYQDIGKPMLAKLGMNPPVELSWSRLMTSQLPTAITEMSQAYANAKFSMKDTETAKAIAWNQYAVSFLGVRGKYEPYIPYEQLKTERYKKYREKAGTWAPSLLDLIKQKKLDAITRGY
jgi:hypothetical protein